MNIDSIRNTIAVTCLTLAIPQITQANSWSVESPVDQAIVIELFTSEGCSSCPPADKWLSTLTQHTGLFERVIPIAYHVTYWDYLGWQDPYGLESHNQRHRKQARHANSGVYTPGMFVQGREWRNWRRQSSALTFPETAEVGVLAAKSVGNQAIIQFEPTSELQLNNPEVSITFLRSNQSTNVTAGENRGRRLEHEFVAGAVQTARLRANGTAWEAAISITPPAGANAIAIWLKDGDGQYIQAAGTFL